MRELLPDIPVTLSHEITKEWREYERTNTTVLNAYVQADGREPVVVGKTARFHLKKGDVARLITATGGGWGNPYERPVEAVQRDVRDGYITVEMAKRDYGVIKDPDRLEVIGVTKERGQTLVNRVKSK